MPDKLQHLLEIADEPQMYSEEHIREALQDPETAEDYAMMVLAAQAFEAQKGDTKDDDIPMHEMHVIFQQAKRRRIQRLAAIFLTLFLVSGLAVAALLPIWRSKTKTIPQVEMPKTTEVVKETKQADFPKEKTVEHPAASIVVFQDEPLETIMEMVCSYYHLKPVFRNEEVRQLRFHLKWNRRDGIDVFLKRLSQFEKVTVTRENDVVIIE